MTRWTAKMLAARGLLDRVKAAVPVAVPAPSKYGNERTNGFDSRREAKRYDELRLLEKAGLISDLQCQVPFELVPANEDERAVTYIADFVYRDALGAQVIEDAKGSYRKDEWVIKRKLMRHVHGIRVKEV